MLHQTDDRKKFDKVQNDQRKLKELMGDVLEANWMITLAQVAYVLPAHVTVVDRSVGLGKVRWALRPVAQLGQRRAKLDHVEGDSRSGLRPGLSRGLELRNRLDCAAVMRIRGVPYCCL
jgi:hypothetical protein